MNFFISSRKIYPLRFMMVSTVNHLLGVALVSSNPTVAVEDSNKIEELQKKIKLQKAVLGQLSKNISPTMSIFVHQAKQICSNINFFKQASFQDFSKPSFDDLSIHFVKMVLDPDYFQVYQPKLPSIFNSYFNQIQLIRHLNNFLEYIDGVNLKGEVRKDAIKKQISYISLEILLKLVGSEKDFHLSLETANYYEDLTDGSENFESRMSKIREKWGDFIESFADEQKNLLVAEEMLASETPTSIFEAQSIYLSHVARYQMTALVGATVTSALPGPFKALGAAALALPVVSSIARKVYLRWMRTTPIAVPPLTDYSKKNKNSFSSTFIGRDDIFETIQRIWKQQKHPILVGEPGVGKTTIIMELGRRIAMGEMQGFEGKTLFAGSAALLNEQSMMGTPAFPRVIKTLNAYRDNVILALDEAHALASDKNNLTLLRTATDNSRESLRYCLFATTPDGYEIFQKDESLRRRIVKIDIPSLSKEELMYFLYQEAKLISPLLTVADKVMEMLYEKTHGHQNETRQLLHKVLTYVESNNMSFPLIKKRDQKAFEVELFLTQYRSHHASPAKENEIALHIKKGKSELENLNRECQTEKEIREKHILFMERLSDSKERRLFLSKKIYQLLTEEAKKNGNEEKRFSYLSNAVFTKKNEVELKELIFLQYMDIPYQLTFLNKFENLHGLVSLIEKETVESFIDKIPSSPRLIEGSTPTDNLAASEASDLT